MRIQYIGHSCFYIVTNDGVRLVIDPYDDSIGLTHVHLTADIALISHHHPDHDCLDDIDGSYTLVDGPGEFTVHGVHIHGIEIPHDAQGGALRGMVTSYLIEHEGLRILHLGDAGSVPPDSFFDEIGAPIDVLMVPVGGFYTIDAREAFVVCERIDPNLIIPMHYRTTRLKLNIAPVTSFIGLVKYSYDLQRQGDVLIVERGDRKKRGRVILMENSF